MIIDHMERFMRHVNRPIDVNECWNWTGYISKSGYGRFKLNEKYDIAHRAAYILWKGDIPPKMVVRHTCRNKCVNPAHLQIGTTADNQRDRIRDGTDPIGSRNNNSKLTENDIHEIRRRHANGETFASIGRSFGVWYTTIVSICKGLTWKHVI